MHEGCSNITSERGCSSISSLAILTWQTPFWPADMHTVHAREWREGLKPVIHNQFDKCDKSKLLGDLSRMPNRILTRFLQRFFFSLYFSRARKNLCYQGSLVGKYKISRNLVYHWKYYIKNALDTLSLKYNTAITWKNREKHFVYVWINK